MLHCVVDLKAQPLQFVCTRCGGTAPFPLPLSIQQMKALTDQFMVQHKQCPPRKVA